MHLLWKGLRRLSTDRQGRNLIYIFPEFYIHILKKMSGIFRGSEHFEAGRVQFLHLTKRNMGLRGAMWLQKLHSVECTCVSPFLQRWQDYRKSWVIILLMKHHQSGFRNHVGHHEVLTLRFPLISALTPGNDQWSHLENIGSGKTWPLTSSRWIVDTRVVSVGHSWLELVTFMPIFTHLCYICA